MLYVISTQTGGTPQTNLDLMRGMADRYNCWLLRCDSRVITLSELVDDVLVVRETHPLERWVEPVTHRSDEYDQVWRTSFIAIRSSCYTSGTSRGTA